MLACTPVRQGELETKALAGMRHELLAVALEMQKDGI